MSAVARLPTDPQQPLDTRALAAACRAAARAAEGIGDDRPALEAALDRLHDAFPEDLLLSLFLREHGRLWLVAERGYNIVPDGVGPERGVLGRAVRTAEPQFAPDVRSDPDYVASADGIVSELALPLGGERPACAVLNVESRRRLDEAGAAALGRLGERLTARVESLRHLSATDVSALARLFVHTSTLRDPEALSDVATSTLARLLDLELAQANLGPPGRRRKVSSAWAASTDIQPLPTEVLEAVARGADRNAVLDVVDLRAVAPAAASALGWRSVVWMPMRVSGVEIGVLAGASRRSLELEHGRAELASLLAAHLAASIDAADALARERRAAVTDPLTGVLNRRGLDERLDEEVARAADNGAALSVIVLDGDDFKQINDAGGHELGDRVLSAVGRFLQNTKRSCDVAARLGGDEFVVVLRGAGRKEARRAASRLRAGVRDTLARAGHTVSVSLGIATFPRDGRSSSDLLRAADRAMYRAKEQGKDRTVSYAQLVSGSRRLAGDEESGALVELADRRSARADNGRRPTPGVLGDIGALTATAAALGRETTREKMLASACRELTDLLGAAAATASRLSEGLLHEVAESTTVGLPPTDQYVYALADYPLTDEAVRSGRPRAVSLGELDADLAEAFVLRELGMQAVLILPVVVGGTAWGILEVYDSRPRRFGPVDLGVAEFVVAQVGRLLQGFESAEAMEQFHWETLASVTSALEAKDLDTSRHTEEVRTFAVDLARNLGLAGDSLRTVELGALLHDIGKIRVPESILNKPGPLEPDEWEVIRSHPVVGEHILAPISPLRDVLPIVRSHHERWAGGGYPDGLAGEEIPLGARIIAVCDAWRAMNEPRPYRAPLAREHALRELRAHAGSQFDPRVVRAALDLLEPALTQAPVLHRPPS